MIWQSIVTELLLGIIEIATEVAEKRFYDSLPADGEGITRDAVFNSWNAYLSLVDRSADVVAIQLRESHSPHPEVAAAIKQLTDVRRAYLASRYRRVALKGTTVNTEALSEMVEALALGALTNYLHTPESDRPRRKVEMTERLTTMTLAAIAGFKTKDR